MKYLLILTLLAGCTTLKNNTKARGIEKIKTRVEKIYSTYECEIDELITHTESGFDRKENRSYFIDFTSIEKDTVTSFPETESRKTGDRNCFYSNDKLIVCREKKDQIIKLFFPPELNKPQQVELYDEKGLIATIAPSGDEDYPYVKSFITDRQLDDHGNLTFYMETKYYLPTDFDIRIEGNFHISKSGLIQSGTSKVYEYQYEYY